MEDSGFQQIERNPSKGPRMTSDRLVVRMVLHIAEVIDACFIGSLLGTAPIPFTF
jgi:hypothetical protein